MGQNRPIVSIILPCYIRPEVLWYGLFSIAKQIKLDYSYEIIVLNDGKEGDRTKEVCDYFKEKYGLNIKYIFTGERNVFDKYVWRVPGAVFNIGAKVALGEILILSSPEMFHLERNSINKLVKPLLTNSKLLTIPNGKDDIKGVFLNHLKKIKHKYDVTTRYNIPFPCKVLNTKLPFCMGITKKQFDAIGGFDKKFFEGFCFDDNDFVDRLIQDGCSYMNVQTNVIHLFNSRKTEDRIGLQNKNKMWERNKHLYNVAKDIRNVTAIKKEEPQSKKPRIAPPIKPRSKTKDVVPKIILQDESAGDKNRWHLENIPKIAHFYWGETKLPYLRYLTVSSFVKFNPDWTVKFYYPKKRQKQKSWSTHEHKYDLNIKKNYYKQLRKLPIELIEYDIKKELNISNEMSEVHKSDYLRWHLLSTVGGFWGDMDIVFFDSMNKINVNRVQNKAIDTVVCYKLPFAFSIGFMLSSANNDYYKHIKDKALKHYNPNNYQTMGTQLLNNISYDQMIKKFPHLVVGNLSYDTVYAYNTHRLKEIYKTNTLKHFKPCSIGLHWYAGHPLACKYINELTEKNYDSFDSVLSKTVRNSIIKKGGIKLTAHIVCKNEPLIYYAVKSVYDYCSTILLYDTGTDDKLALEGIDQLLKEDTLKKIKFKIVPIDSDETQTVWTELDTEPHNKFGVCQIRQMMIDDTDTEFFLTVDGDEIYYKETMEEIINVLIPNLKKNIYEVGIPLIWFASQTTLFDCGCPVTGRILRTDKVCVIDAFPHEGHAVKKTREKFTLKHKNYLIYRALKAFCHFSNMLKPWRQKHVNKTNIRLFEGKLPEVILKNRYYIDKFSRR